MKTFLSKQAILIMLSLSLQTVEFYDLEIKEIAKSFLDNLGKNAKDYILTAENVICDKYDAPIPRVDQIRERAPKIGQEIIVLLENIKKMLITDPSIDNTVIFSFCSILDKQNFVIPNYLYKLEMLRLEFDTFGRIKKTNESKSKYLWSSFFIIKVLIKEVLTKLAEITGNKLKPVIVL